MGSSPGFLGNLFRSMPELGTPAPPARPRISVVRVLPSALLTASASQPAEFSELNLHGLLPCCVRFAPHWSPGEWQHSLPACLLDSDRAGLTPAGFHQEVSPSHSRFLLFQTFPSAITMSAVSITFCAY